MAMPSPAAADAPVAAADDHPLVSATLLIADQLRARAALLESDGVTREDTAALAAIGLYAVGAPATHGGVPGPVARRVAEILAGASPDAWFVWFQHGPVLKMLAHSDNAALAARWLAPLASGHAQAGVAYSHLRTAHPSITATRASGGGWSLTGSQPWCTGWGLIDVVLVGAVTEKGPDQQVVFALVPVDVQHLPTGIRSTGELALAAMGGTSTHSISFESLAVPDEDVVAVRSFAEWAEADRIATPNLLPSTVGLTAAATALLAARDPAAADRLRRRGDALRDEAYALIDDVAASEQTARRLALRAEAMLLSTEAAGAALAARGGQGMDLANPEQRLLRAAAFQLVHAQTGPVKAATLQQVAR